MKSMYAVSIVRLTDDMLQSFKGDTSMVNWQAAKRVVDQSMRDNILNGGMRKTLTVAIGDCLVPPLRYHSDEYKEMIDMIDRLFNDDKVTGEYSLLELLEQICGKIREDLGLKKSTGSFGKGVYRFEVCTCLDKPAMPQNFMPLAIQQVAEVCEVEFVITILRPIEAAYSIADSDIWREIELLRKISPNVTVRYLDEYPRAMHQPMKYLKPTTTVFKGIWQISPDLRIPVKAGKKVVLSNLPSMKRFSQQSSSDDTIFTGKLIAQKLYHEQGEIDKEVPPENVIKGYYYGREVVPFPRHIMDRVKVKESKQMVLLTFCRVQDIKRKYLLGTAYQFFVDSKAIKDITTFKAILSAMRECDKIAICRMVLRDNSAPKLFGLFAMPRDNEVTEMYGIELPTSEDLRDYYFPMLKKSTEDQRQVLEDLIIDNELADDDFDALTLDDPILMRVNLATVGRHIEGRDKQVESLIDAKSMGVYFAPPARVPEHLAATFGLKVNEIKKSVKIKKTYWEAKVKEEKEKQALLVEGKGAEEELEGKKGDTADDAFKTSPDTVSTNRPINDFDRMISDKKADKVSLAISQMQQVIRRLTEESVGDISVIKALECLKVLRNACIKEDEWSAFNDFLNVLKAKSDSKSAKYMLLWRSVVQACVTLISSDENRLSSVSPKESLMFIEDADRLIEANNGIGMQAERRSEGLDDID